jgi:catechol O-methyltransferase
MSLTRRLPFLRWSFIRLAWGARNITTTGQVGDGREAAAADFVETQARPGDLDGVIAAIDRFAYEHSYLINVGDEKGLLLDAAVRRVSPSTALELGTYCGYSALRIARAAPQARVFSVELSAANAGVAHRIWTHAGVADRVTCVVGTIGDGGTTLDALGFAPGELDFLFLDHAKDAYLTDLRAILDRGWLRTGAVVVADNVGIPGAPRYRAYMKEHQGGRWRTVEHKTHAEYQSLLADLVLESDYLGS